MSKAIPYGKTEGAKLEFKSRDSRPVDVAREVVAFLNAEGGAIWWGVKEAKGRAESAEPYLDVEERRRDLQNHLIDTIEPSPKIPDEVDIRMVPAGADGSIICVEVKKASAGRTPVAQLKEQGRRYWLRVGDRVRIMTREEIRREFSQSAAENLGIEEGLIANRERILEKKNPCFWMEIHPSRELDCQSFDVGDKALEELLMNPAATGNRRNGWNFIHELTWPRVGPRGLNQGDDIERIEIGRTGAISFTTALDRLHWKGGERMIWPYALLEYPVSVMRLAAKVFERWGASVSELLVDFAIVGLRGWTLRGGSPTIPSWRHGEPEPFAEDNIVPMKPFKFEKNELVTEPDRCSLRLITEIYESFGYRRDAIPPEFDQKTATLAIPS